MRRIPGMLTLLAVMVVAIIASPYPLDEAPSPPLQVGTIVRSCA